jgi:hypothetical protein
MFEWMNPYETKPWFWLKHVLPRVSSQYHLRRLDRSSEWSPMHIVNPKSGTALFFFFSVSPKSTKGRSLLPLKPPRWICSPYPSEERKMTRHIWSLSSSTWRAGRGRPCYPSRVSAVQSQVDCIKISLCHYETKFGVIWSNWICCLKQSDLSFCTYHNMRLFSENFGTSRTYVHVPCTQKLDFFNFICYFFQIT